MPPAINKSSRIAAAPAASEGYGRDVEQNILRSRGEITELYRILLHSPVIADGWESLLTAIRQKTSIQPRLRELIILRIAVLNNAPYEFKAHTAHARQAGISEHEIESLRQNDLSLFADTESTVLAYTDAMTLDIVVSDPIFAGIRDHFDDAACVELTATIAAYNMVSRFLAALDVR